MAAGHLFEVCGVNAGRSKMLAAKACIGVMYPTQVMPLMVFKRQAVASSQQ